MQISNAERSNGNPLSEEDKQEIDSKLCYSLQRAKTQIMCKYTDIIQEESEDKLHQMVLANEFLKNSIQYLKELMELNGQPNGVYSSSVLLDLVFQSCNDLEEFMDKFRIGKVTEITQNALITKEILVMMDLQNLQLSVNISEEDFWQYHEKLLMEDIGSKTYLETTVIDLILFSKLEPQGALIAHLSTMSTSVIS